MTDGETFSVPPPPHQEYTLGGGGHTKLEILFSVTPRVYEIRHACFPSPLSCDGLLHCGKPHLYKLTKVTGTIITFTVAGAVLCMYLLMSTVKVTVPVKVTTAPVTFINFYRRGLPQSSKPSQGGGGVLGGSN